MNGYGCGRRREYISLEALDLELKRLMERRGVNRWTQVEFDAADIDALIHEIPEEYAVVIEADGTLKMPEV